jgi:periplasmic divalent cation tolerance protein
MLVEKVNNAPKEIVFVYTTCASIEEAKSIGLSCINEKLTVSVDYWPIGSIYPWKGVLQDVEQYMIMLTTEKELSDRLIKYVGGLHPYTTPMIARMDTAVMNPTYKFWVEATLNNKEAYITEQEERIQEINDEEDGYHFGKLK